MVFNANFHNISVILWQSVLLVEETRVPGEDHWPVASHWKTLSHNVVSSTPRHDRGSNWMLMNDSYLGHAYSRNTAHWTLNNNQFNYRGINLLKRKCPYFLYLQINFRVNWRDNHEWTMHKHTQYWIQDTQRINQKHNTETRNTGYKTQRIHQKHKTETRNTGYKTHNV